MSLMGSKLEASPAIEGKFSEDGLLALTQGEDMTTAMARALVDGLETEGVEQMWSKLNQANKAEYRETAPDGSLFYTDPENFLKKKRTRRRRKKAASGSEQLLLFGICKIAWPPEEWPPGLLFQAVKNSPTLNEILFAKVFVKQSHRQLLFFERPVNLRVLRFTKIVIDYAN